MMVADLTAEEPPVSGPFTPASEPDDKYAHEQSSVSPWRLSLLVMFVFAFYLLVVPHLCPPPRVNALLDNPDALGNVQLHISVFTMGQGFHIETYTGATAYLGNHDGSTTSIKMWAETLTLMQSRDGWDVFFPYPRQSQHTILLKPPTGTLALFQRASNLRINGALNSQWNREPFYVLVLRRLTRGTMLAKYCGKALTWGKATQPFQREYVAVEWK